MDGRAAGRAQPVRGGGARGVGQTFARPTGRRSTLFCAAGGRSPSEAQDLTQSFVAHLIERNTFAHAAPEKGQLRTFLLGSLQNFLANEYDRATALKRGGGQPVVSMDDHLVEAEAALQTVARGDESKGYDRHWATNLVGRAWMALSHALVAEGRKDWARSLQAVPAGGSGPAAAAGGRGSQSWACPSRRFATRSGGCASATARASGRKWHNTVADPSQVDDEMRYLLQVLLS